MKKAILTVALAICGTAYSTAETRCPLNAMTSTGISSPALVSFDQFEFNMGAQEASATVRITNRATRPINAFFMVVDFHESGRYVLSMIFYLATSGQEKSFQPAARVSRTFITPGPISSSILPGESYRDSEESTVRPLTCPDEARIAVLQIAFADGKSFDHRVPGWRVDPALLHISPWSLRGFPTKPISASSRVSINEEGRLRVVALGFVESEVNDDSELSWWLIKQLEGGFRYVPAQYEGAPIACEMNLLIRFYPTEGSDPASSLPRDWAKPSLTVVDLVSAAPGKAYELIYAGYPMLGQPLRKPKSP